MKKNLILMNLFEKTIACILIAAMLTTLLLMGTSSTQADPTQSIAYTKILYFEQANPILEKTVAAGTTWETLGLPKEARAIFEISGYNMYGENSAFSDSSSDNIKTDELTEDEIASVENTSVENPKDAEMIEESAQVVSGSGESGLGESGYGESVNMDETAANPNGSTGSEPNESTGSEPNGSTGSGSAGFEAFDGSSGDDAYSLTSANVLPITMDDAVGAPSSAIQPTKAPTPTAAKTSDDKLFIQTEPKKGNDGNFEYLQYGYTAPNNEAKLRENGQLVIYTVNNADGSYDYRIHGILKGYNEGFYATNANGEIFGYVMNVPLSWEGEYNENEPGIYTLQARIDNYNYNGKTPAVEITVNPDDVNAADGAGSNDANDANDANGAVGAGGAGGTGGDGGADGSGGDGAGGDADGAGADGVGADGAGADGSGSGGVGADGTGGSGNVGADSEDVGDADGSGSDGAGSGADGAGADGAGADGTGADGSGSGDEGATGGSSGGSGSSGNTGGVGNTGDSSSPDNIDGSKDGSKAEGTEGTEGAEGASKEGELEQNELKEGNVGAEGVDGVEGAEGANDPEGAEGEEDAGEAEELEWLEAPILMRGPAGSVPNSISGFFWVDGNGSESTDWDGLYNGYEWPLVGFPVSLYYANDLSTAIATTLTDSDGEYIFENLAPDDYILGLKGGNVGGYEFLAPIFITSENKFAIDWAVSGLPAYTAVITLTVGQAVEDINAAMRLPMGISALANYTLANIGSVGRNDTVTIDGWEWYVVRTQVLNGVTYYMIASRNLRNYNNFENSRFGTSQNYEGSALQARMTAYLQGFPTIKQIAAVPTLGNHFSNMAVTDPTGVLARDTTQTKDIMFAMSIRDYINWNNGSQSPLIAPLTGYFQRAWSRTAAPQSTAELYGLFGITPGGSGYTGLDAGLMYTGQNVGEIPAVWLNGSAIMQDVTVYYVDTDGNLIGTPNYATYPVLIGNSFTMLDSYIPTIPTFTYKRWKIGLTGTEQTTAFPNPTLTSAQVTAGTDIYLIFERAGSDLTISKMMKYESNMTKDFTFNVTLLGSSSNPLSPGMTFTVEGGTVSGSGAVAPTITTLTLNASSVLTFTLRHGQKLTIKGVPNDCNVLVSEALSVPDTDRYGVKHSINGAAEQNGASTGMIAMSTSGVTVDYINERVSSLKVSKEGKNGINSTKEFDFEVLLKPNAGNVLTPGSVFETVGGIISGSGAVPPTYASLTLGTGNILSFTLRHGQTLLIKGIPFGYEVEVSEIVNFSNYRYDTTYSVNGGAEIEDTSTNSIPMDRDEVTIDFINTRVYIVPTGFNADDFPYLLEIVLLITGLMGFVIIKRFSKLLKKI